MSPRLQLTPAVAGARCSGWAASSRNGSSPTTSSPRSWTPTTSGSAPGSASRAGASRTRTRCWSTWPPTRAPARQGLRAGADRHRHGHRRHLHAARHIPNAAAQVAHRSASPPPAAFDINTACAGFCYGIAVAADRVRAGTVRHVLVIGAEKLSDWIDWDDRATAIIFADGAGAAVVGAAPDAETWASGRSSGAARATSRRRSGSSPTPAPAPGGPGGVPLGHHPDRPGGAARDRAGRPGTRRHRRARPPPGEPADHRGRRQAVAQQGRARRPARRRRHRALGQHLVGLDPAGPGPHAHTGRACGPARPCCS